MIRIQGGIALGLLGLFAPMAIFRFVDADEGTFVIAARLVMDGAIPHHDFFYPYTALLPYVYGAWRLVAGESWYAARGLSVLFAVGIGLLLYAHTRRLAGRTTPALGAVALWALHGLTLGWLPLVKTYTLSTLMLLAAVVVLDGRRRAGWAQIASGVLLGLAIDTRPYLGAVGLVLVLAAMAASEGVRGKVLAALRVGLGALVAVLPNAWLALSDPDRFFFNVLGAHGIRSEWGLVGNLGQKLDVAWALVALDGREGLASLQFILLLALTGVLVVARVRRGAPIPIAVPVAAVLGAASFAPTPVHAQYFCAIVPFLAVTAALGLGEIQRAAAGRAARGLALRHVATAAVLVYAVGGLVEVHRYTVDPWQIPGVVSREDAPNWRISTIEAVAREMDAQASGADGPALSWWPGYFGSSRVGQVPKMENHNAPSLAEKLGTRADRYRLMSDRELQALLERRSVDVVVMGNWAFGPRRLAYRKALDDSGYRLVEKIGDAEIYRAVNARRGREGPSPGRRGPAPSG